MRSSISALFGNPVAMGLTVLVLASPATADQFFWNNQTTNRDWSRGANWVSVPEHRTYPELTTDTAYVQGVTNYNPVLDFNRRIGQLLVRTGAQLSTGDGTQNWLLTVTAVKGGVGYSLIDGSGSSLTVYRSTNHADFDTDFLGIAGGAALHLRDGGIVEVDDKFSITVGSGIDGAGLINLTGQDDIRDSVNDGTIDSWGGTLSFIGHDDAFLDLDGVLEDGRLVANNYSSLIIDVAVEDEFNGTMWIARGSELQINHPWTLGTGRESTLAFNGGFGDDRAMLSGDAVTLRGPVVVNSGDALLMPPVMFDSNAIVTVVDGATMQVATSAFIDQDALFRGDGELVVNDGAEIELDQNADVEIAVRNDGIIDIADESMTTVTFASFEQGPTGSFEFTVCGQDDGESFDHLTVTGTATLDGELVLVPDNKCEPAVGDEFPIITAGSVVGAFALVTGVENAEVVYTETTATVVVTSGCVADIDGSGTVDFDDLLAVLAAWGNAGGPEDVDGDGEVGFGDLLIVLASWGPCE